MVDIFSVLLIGSVVSFLMYQNINKITRKIEESTKDNSPRYAIFSRKLQDFIRGVKRDLDSDMECTDPRYCKNDSCDENKTTRELNDLIRRASMHESVGVKKRSKKEVEGDFVDILQKLDNIVRSNCLDGEKQAELLKDEIFEEFQKVLA